MLRHRAARRLAFEPLNSRLLMAASALAPSFKAPAESELAIYSGAGGPQLVSADGRQMEFLNRGLVAVRRTSSQIYIGWRMLGTDPTNIAFNLYRSANGATPVK